MITRENYEEYLMLEADGELDAAGQRALDEFFRTYPELETERAMWQSVRLLPDQELHFPDKDQLLKPVPRATRRVIPIMWAAAAAVILFMILIPLLLKNDEKQNQLTRSNAPTQSAPIETAPMNPNPQTPAPETPAQPKETVNVAHKPLNPVQPDFPTKPEPRQPEPVRHREPAPLEMIADHQELAPVPRNEVPQPLQADLSAAYANAASESVRSSHQINLAPVNQDAVRLLKDAMDQRINQAKNVAKNLRETAFEIRVKKGAININF